MDDPPAPPASTPPTTTTAAEASGGLVAIARELHAHGWAAGTGGNYSVRLSADPLRLLVSASGKHKDRMGPEDFLVIGPDGLPAEPTRERPSAETMLHVVLAAPASQGGADAGAVLHTHSVWGTLLSDWGATAGLVTLSGYEILKALPGIETHDTSVEIPVFPNTQDIPALAEEVRARLGDPDAPRMHAFLIHKHGLYAWGETLLDARRHVEALEYLFECEGRRLSMPTPPSPGPVEPA